MKIAILGASGEIGARLTQVLMDRGSHPRAISRKLSPRLARWGSLDFHAIDLSDVRALRRALQDCDCVINCAVDKSEIFPVSNAVSRNVEACQILLNAARQCRIKRIIHLSSIVVVPPRLTREAIEHPHSYSREKDWYTKVKIETEQVMVAGSKHCEIIIVRPGVVYGPYMHWSRLAFSRMMRGGVVLPMVSSQCHAIHIDDLVDLIIMLAAKPSVLPELIWAVNPEPLSWDTYFNAHGKAIGCKYEVLSLPSNAIESHFNAWIDGSSLSKEVLVWLYRCPLLPNKIRSLGARAKKTFHLPELRPSDAPDDDCSVSWPTRFELQLFSSDAVFENENCGGKIGYSYQINFDSGIRSAASYWLSDFETLSSPNPVFVRA